MKKTITINLDIELIERGKKKQINMSATINELLKDFFGPKSSVKKEEDKLLILQQIAGQLSLSPDEIQFLEEHQAHQTVGVWKLFKGKFNPDFDLWRFIVLRREVKELLIKSSGDKK